MSRSVSQAAKTAMFAQYSGKALLALITIEHPNLSQTLRYVNDGQNIVSRTNVYQWFPFDIFMPADSADDIPEIKIDIFDPTRQIAPQIRALTSKPTITLELILADSPDTVEAGPFIMTLNATEWDVLRISGTLGYEDIWNEPYPGNTFSPAEYPGLF